LENHVRENKEYTPKYYQYLFQESFIIDDFYFLFSVSLVSPIKMYYSNKSCIIFLQ
jgi:hypothetical protein